MPRSPTTSTSAAVLMTYRKDGTAVAASVSFLFRDNTLEVRAVPLRTAVDATAASIAEITWKTLVCGAVVELPTHGPTSAPPTS
jgi:hypothetical protein